MTGIRAVVPMLALGLVLTACGDDDEDTTAQTGNETEATPSSAPAAEPLEAGMYQGTFKLLSVAPKGTKKIGGTAHMEVTASKTLAEIAATGLDPKATYIVHVHKNACSDEAGGTHFMFDYSGEPKPPNEVWITPKVGAKGKGTGKTTASKPVNSDAKSMVIHLKRAAGAKKDEKTPPKLACADLEPHTM
jgi:hypothetical protein